MSYPQMVEYNEAVQHPETAFINPELRLGKVRENNLGLPLPLSGGFALTYTVTTPRRKLAVRCFHRQVPSIEQKYAAISKRLKSLSTPYFVDFAFQPSGIKVKNGTYPIVCMDWVEGDTLGTFLDKNIKNEPILQKVRKDFQALSSFLEANQIAHGDLQNGNVMVQGGQLRLIDYDGMYVPELPRGNGSELGHRHFQHPKRGAADFGPLMDRFSFIALDVSFLGILEAPSLYPKYREGGETILFKANDFADPDTAEIFKLLLQKPSLKAHVENFSAICKADLGSVPALADFLAGRNIPKPRVHVRPVLLPAKPVGYIPAFDVVDATKYQAAAKQVGNKVELIGKIVEVKPGSTRRGLPYIFINFGPWKGEIVKVTLWSEGLQELKNTPDLSWVGRWISVTGLMDPPYHSRRYRYVHLSVTVTEEGQIHVIDKKEAEFRLARTKPPVVQPPRQQPVANRRGTNTLPPPVTPPIETKNKDILTAMKKGTPTPGPAPAGVKSPKPPTTPPSQPSPSGFGPRAQPQPQSRRLLSRVPGWVWFVGFIVLLLILARGR